MTSSPLPTPTHSVKKKSNSTVHQLRPVLCDLWLLPKQNTCVNPTPLLSGLNTDPAIVAFSFCLPSVKWVFPSQPLFIPQRLAATTLPPPRQPNVTSKKLRNGHLSLPRQCLRNVGRRETNQRKCPKHPAQSSNTLNHINHRPMPPKAFHLNGPRLCEKTRK